MKKFLTKFIIFLLVFPIFYICLIIIYGELTPSYLYKNLFFKKLNEIKNDSAVRSCAKICEMLCTYHYVKNTVDFSEVLNKAERKKLTECCFNWLITDQKVACQAPAMECLYFLGMDNDKQWIYPELKNILIKDAAYKSAGYKARARKILNKI